MKTTTAGVWCSIAMLISTGCSPNQPSFAHKEANPTTSKIGVAEYYWGNQDLQNEFVGNFSALQVAEIKSAISLIQFPVRQERATFLRLIAPSVRPYAITNWDNFGRKPSEPFGGIIEDYWLNKSAVLRVTTTYRGDDKAYFNIIESAEIISAEIAYRKGVSLGGFKIKHPQ
ncbi:hypothetical protein [Oleiharenicola lentus]|uniref:hypothetical protein n=1 Tax=Oleiharenicola lentus TaxID=2508720 RepID=UPI003F67EDEC